MENNLVYIHSINKHVTMEEFLAYLPKVGEVVMINKHNFIRRTQDTKESNLNFEQFVCLSVGKGFDGAGTIQVSYSPEYYIASGDLVNRIADGTYRIIPGIIFDHLYSTFKTFAEDTGKMMELYSAN